MFSGICYRTQENEIKRKLQCKLQGWQIGFYAAIHLYGKKWGSIQTWHFIWAHFNIDGETLVCVHLKSQRGRLRIGTSFGETDFESCPQNEAIIKR